MGERNFMRDEKEEIFAGPARRDGKLFREA